MRFLLTLFCLGCLTTLAAQTPDFVPTQGLVGWYDFAEGTCDVSGQSGCFDLIGGAFIDAAEGSDDGALRLDGNYAQLQANSGFNLSEFTLAFRFNFDADSRMRVWKGSPSFPDDVNFIISTITSAIPHNFNYSEGCSTILDYGSNGVEIPELNVPETWIDVVISRTQNGLVTIHTAEGTTQVQRSSSECTASTPIRIGHWWNNDTSPCYGWVDHFGVWSTVLSDFQAAQIIGRQQLPVSCSDLAACNYSIPTGPSFHQCIYPGCTDETACNYNDSAGCDDFSCVYPPAVNIPDTLFFCDSIVINPGIEANQILWSTGQASPTASIFETGTYSVVASNDQGCVEELGFSLMQSTDSTMFWLSPGPTTWPMAQEMALTLGGHLATFSNPTEQILATNSLNGTPALFGLYQNLLSETYSEPLGGWEWCTGEPLTYATWDQNQPDNYTPNGEPENFGQLFSSGLWNDVRASYGQLRYLLETPLAICGCTTTQTFVAIKGVNGCTNSLACNFEPDASCDDGSCILAAEFYDCQGQCLLDEDGDGVCDELEIAGCMDQAACNFAPEATDEDGSCIFATVIFDCDGECQNDADGNGVCDEYESMCGTSYDLGFSEGYQAGLIVAQAGQCGPGTMWDSTYQLCLPAEQCVGDLSGDGYVGTVDLLLVLSAYGEDCP